MGKVKQKFLDMEVDDPDQEYSESEIVAVAVPVLIEVISVCLMFACAILWCGIGAGRI